MGCNKSGNPIIDAFLGFFEFLGDPIGTIVGTIADFILYAAFQVFGAIITGIPTLESTATSKDISGQTRWIVVYLAVGSLLFAAARMAIERKGTAGITALKGILRVVLVSGAATLVVGAAVAVSDEYATHLFNAGATAQLKQIGGCSDIGGVGSFVKLILAFLLLIAGILQTILLYVRMGVMIVLLGTLPVAAAASMTDWGSGWWRKHLGWMIAWLLYKPAAGLVLYAGSVMTGAGKTAAPGEANITIHTRIAGIAVMLLSAVALPALLKLIVPATAALGTGNPAGQAVGVAGGVASGAIQLAGGGSGGGGEQSGRRGPSGASGAGGGTGSSGSSGSRGSSAGGGSSGSSGSQGPGGALKPTGGGGGGSAGGAGAGGGGAGTAAAARGVAGGAAAAAGPAAAAVTLVTATTQAVAQGAAGAVEGADGRQGHNE
ncbi:hypothetical protein ACIQAC_15215 [Streptomyces sp. NPDC088387]|uniref:hypothetical protein n=1 Tax=Streptomyces sp. NPDC088387 TaxID=3365859 RepID=UPI0038021DAC